MAETTDFVSTIRVKDLISAFESKSDSVKVEFTRPRAKSVGNILAKNVIIRQNEFNSLDDIEKALKKLEASLNFYEVYNKEKHVTFQEHLFNILTSIVNIEGNDDESTARKKKLISKTQTLVSFLNQKLPSNANQMLNSYKYTTYSSHVKDASPEETKPSKQSLAIYSEKNKTIDITDSGQDFVVSVRKLKENFQPKNESNTESLPQDKKSLKTQHMPKAPVVNGQKPDKEETKQEKVEDRTPENVSVMKLRNLFEKKSEETSKGLGIISDDKPQQDKLIISSTNINIPYTERNLGNVRLQRSVSGNYMNYTGLLKRIDISKSTSDLNREPAEVIVRDKDSSSGESDVESEDSLDTIEERKSVREIRQIYSGSSLDKGGEVAVVDDRNSLSGESDADSEDSLDTIEERKSVQEIRKIYSSPILDNSDLIKGKNATDHLDNKTVSILHAAEDIKVKYSTTISEHRRPNELNPSILVNESPKNTNTEETKSNLEGFQELEIKYFTATSDDINKETESQEKIATVEGVEQEEIKYATPEANIIPNEESVATLNGVEEAVTFSIAGSDDVKEETSQYDIDSRTIINNSILVPGSPLDMEESFIEDEIDKIDVEPTLADEELVVNAEDLKNADNEFEKLLESSTV